MTDFSIEDLSLRLPVQIEFDLNSNVYNEGSIISELFALADGDVKFREMIQDFAEGAGSARVVVLDDPANLPGFAGLALLTSAAGSIDHVGTYYIFLNPSYQSIEHTTGKEIPAVRQIVHELAHGTKTALDTTGGFFGSKTFYEENTVVQIEDEIFSTYGLPRYLENRPSTIRRPDNASPPRLIDPPCFSAETPIQLSDGSARAIEDIKLGDTVAAFDEHADFGRGALRDARVTQLLPGVTDAWVVLEDGTRVTPNHP